MRVHHHVQYSYVRDGIVTLLGSSGGSHHAIIIKRNISETYSSNILVAVPSILKNASLNNGLEYCLACNYA
jgi:hypothetical protein